MFTGIVEEVGRVDAVQPAGGGRTIDIAAATVLDGLKAGDSISIDGVCQTVTELLPEGFRVQAVATTLGRTTFREFAPGRCVNLERALAFGDRLGGHLVQGHVDGVGRVLSVERRNEHVLIDFTLPPEIEEVTVLHGSIALNGVSLTVNALPRPGTAQVAIIPFTWDHTTLSDLERGAALNLEGDLIGKHIRRLLELRGGR